MQTDWAYAISFDQGLVQGTCGAAILPQWDGQNPSKRICDTKGWPNSACDSWQANRLKRLDGQMQLQRIPASRGQ